MNKVFTFVLTMLLVPSLCFGSVKFAGDADAIVISNESNFDFALTDSFSISVWIKGNGTAKSLVGKMQQAAPYIGWDLEVHGGGGHDAGDISFFIISSFTGDTLKVYTTTEVNDNSWHHIVATYDGSETASGQKIYLDGTEESTIQYDNMEGGESILNNQSVRIGSRNGGEYSNYEQSEVAIWDTELTATDAAILYTSKTKRVPLQIKPANLVGYWPLDDFSGGTALNKDANGYKDLAGGNHGQGVDADSDSTNVSETVLTYP